MRFPVGWVPRDPPLRPVGVAAGGEAAVRLVRRLRRDLQPHWRGLGGRGWIVVTGDDPPWVDGVALLGRDPLAPRLLLPTHSAPEAAGVPVAALVDRWVAQRCADRPGPYAVVPALGIVPLGAARAIDAEGLGRWAR